MYISILIDIILSEYIYNDHRYDEISEINALKQSKN